MIASKDRSGWFGASDTPYITGNVNTKSFENWWLVKLGIAKNDFANTAMLAGTYFEHRILDALHIPELEKDKQILIEPLRLRVNLDGNTPDTIHEVKTYKYEKGFKVPKKYREQVWVQQFASGIAGAQIDAYGLTDADYRNFYAPIDMGRISTHPIEYNEKWINETYLPALEYKAYCLIHGLWPEH